jgi:hypothetical protein
MEADCVLVLCFDKQCGWLSNGYTEDVAPPYHVAMTRCKSKLTLLHGHKSPPLKSVERMISSDTLTTYFDVYGKLNVELDSKGVDEKEKTYNVTDFVDGYICPISIRKAMDTIDVENVGPETIKDEDGREVCIESAPSIVPSIAHVDSVEDVAGINGTIAELIVSCLLKLPFKSVPALKNLMSPGECVKLKPNALSYDRRLDMRLEYACSKEDSGDMHLETATLAALVHKYKSDGFTTLLSQIRQDVWWSEPHRENVQESILSMLERICGLRHPEIIWCTDVPCDTNICGMSIRGKVDFMGPGFLLETKYVSNLTPVHFAQLVLYSHALDPAHGTHCCLLNLRTGEYMHYLFDRKSVSDFCCELELKQSEIRLSDEMFMQRYGARNSI